MFAEWLDKHSLFQALKDTESRPFPRFADRAAWDVIPEPLKSEALALAERYRVIPYPILTAAQFLEFVRSGDRGAYEAPYFERRRKLIAAAVGCCVSGRLDDLDDVINGIWLICEETSWVISAHNINPIPGAPPAASKPLPDGSDPYIDLFTAQTAMILAVLCDLLGNELDSVAPIIRRRVAQELERRVLTPFMQRDDFWWMGFLRKDLCNWTPWIVSNVMLTACLQLNDRSRLAELLARGCRMLDLWLDCVPEDGGCDEGAGYWNMAGGALLDCLELLEVVTDGAMTFWKVPKVRNILSFPAKAELQNGWFVNFADCDARPTLCGERLQAAGEHLANVELTAVGSRLRGSLFDQISDVPHLTRLLKLLFHPASTGIAGRKPKDIWLPDLQLRIAEKSRSILVAKGGHNGESHNHNDVGSFMLYVNGMPVIVDAGNATYTAQTFSDRRYELWHIRSAWHNVPIIGGCEQAAGSDFRASEVTCSPDGLSLQFAGAYPAEAGVLSCTRRLSLQDDGSLLLQDSIRTAKPMPVAWTLLLRDQPMIDGDLVTIGPMTMQIPAGITCTAEEKPITDVRMARNFPGSLWRLSLQAPAAEAHALSLRFTPINSNK